MCGGQGTSPFRACARWQSIDTENNAKADIPVSAARYDDPGLLEISLSPAMTFRGIDPGCGIEIVQGEAQ
jgi:hypothetical protein